MALFEIPSLKREIGLSHYVTMWFISSKVINTTALRLNGHLKPNKSNKTQRQWQKQNENSPCAISWKSRWLKISHVRWCLFQPGHPLTPTPHQARPEKTRPDQPKPGYPGQQSLFRLDFNPKIISYFFRLLQFPQSNFPLVGAYYLSRSGDVKCFINHFAPSTCRTASVSSQKRFIDSQQIGMGIEKLWVKHASIWCMAHHNEIFWRETDWRKLHGKSANAHFVRQLTNPGWLPWRVIVVSGKSTTGSPHFISLCYFARTTVHPRCGN